jgi:two-component system, cell cycle sensor histidine kinase and response regulator CckA
LRKLIIYLSSCAFKSIIRDDIKYSQSRRMPAAENIPTRINKILDTSNEGFILVDNNENIIDINPKMCAILGRRREDILGRSLYDFVDFYNRKVFRKENKLRDSGQKSSYEVTFTKPDGSEVPCIVHGSPYHEDDGTKVGSFAMVTDISDLKKSEYALRRSERKYRILFENAPSGVLFVDTKGYIRDLNPTLLEILGSPSAEATKSINIFTFQPLVDAGISWAFRNCILSGKPASHESAYKSKWGKEVYLKYRLNPIRREDGSIEGVLASVLDFTENMVSEKRLHATHEVYRSAISNAQGVPYRLNYSTNTYEFFGDGFEKLLSIPATSELTFDILAAMISEIILTESSQKITTNEYLKIYRGKNLKRLRADIKIETPAGAIKWLSDSGVPLQDENTGEVTGVLGIMQDISDRKHIEMELKESERRYKTLYDSSHEAIFLMNVDKFIDCNNRALELFSVRRDRLIGASFHDFSPEYQPNDKKSREFSQGKINLALAEEPQLFEWQHKRPDDSVFFAEISLKRIQLHGEAYLLAMIKDITERKHLEKHLQQSKKLEAVGQLAGGVAHDFNNLLTVIRGYSNLILTQPIEKQTVHKRVKQIEKACERAEHRTQQLLAFGRRQILKPRTLSLNTLISDMKPIITHVIGESIELITNFQPDLGYTKIDPNQIEQVIMNLAINAREAMPRGGKLILETSNAVIDGSTTRRHPEATAGKYIMIAVSDNGLGMNRDIQSHIFEPFFSTKNDTEGAGLGLATVYGIIKQSAGFIWVYSEPNHGTTFRIYLPQIEKDEEVEKKIAPSNNNLHGHETILLVEDEEDVRTLVKETLEMMDYKVVEASNGRDALELYNAKDNSIHLVLTDVVMPVMGGRELAENLLQINSNLKIMYMSGYTEDAIVHNGVLEPGTQFIQKPFTPVSLMQKVRDVLDN